MSILTLEDLNSGYHYVVSREVIRHVDRLILLPETKNSVTLALDANRHSRSILELEGLGAEAWDGIDPREYIKKLRDDWESR